jgi:pimeloyl-ACP methyl ester carboxylesterase
MEVTRRTVAGDGLDLAVWERGDPSTPTVVLVHGYPDTHALWDGVAADLGPDHHVVTYDVRGAGESGVPSDQEGYDLEHLVADLGAVFDAVCPDRRVHLVGHDWGSIQSWEAVLSGRLDGRIATMTSISGPPLGHASRWARERVTLRLDALGQLARQGTRSWYIAMFQLPAVPEAAWRTFQPAMVRRYLRRVEGVPADALPGPTLSSDGANGVNLYRRNVGKARGPDRAADVPVQLIVPADDPFVTRALLEGLERSAPDLTRVDIAGRHWVPLTDPTGVARLIRDHIARHPT